MQPITIQFAVRVRKDYTPLYVYLGCVWVVIYVKYRPITYEGLLHNTLALDVDTGARSVYTANSRLTHEKALCELFRNMSKRNVVRATCSCVVEINSDWLNRFTRTRCHELSLPLNRVCTGQSSDSKRARDQWQCAAVTPQVNLSFSFVSCVSKHLIECIAIESS